MDETEQLEMINEVWNLIETETQKELRLTKLLAREENTEEWIQ